MRSGFSIFIIILIFTSLPSVAQSTLPKWELNGYLSNMQSVMFSEIDEDWINDNLFHNRVNLFWYPDPSITATIQFRNRFMYGEMQEVYPNYASQIDDEPSFLDLSYNIFNEKSFILNTTIDRLHVQYNKGKFVATAGRQRVNWGINYIWNPNDIFNVQNFFDFDYVEKRGSDAIRLQYYTGFTSSAEFAAKLDQNHKLTAAGFYRFNKWGYDFQFLAGIFSEQDYVAGAGWAGDIEGAGFRGEISYFRPMENFTDTSSQMFIAISGDYTFSNSLYLQSEIMFAKLPEDYSITSFLDYYQGPLSVKNLAFSEWTVYSNVSYPFTPIWNASLSAMYFPDLKGFYTGPTLDYSLKDNVMMSIIVQAFSGEFNQERQNLIIGFMRYKFSF